jgi:hypothetical protein
MNTTTEAPVADPVAVRDEWVAAVTALVDLVEGWCKELDWATRRAPKTIEDDAPLGTYRVPMLRMQYWDVQLMLDPVSRFGARNAGQCNLYVMPAYDDLALVYRRGGDWFVRERTPKGLGDEYALTRDSLQRMADLLRGSHAQAG